MEFLDKLIEQTDYLKQLKKLERLEQDRIYCRHGLSHLLDVARIAWLRSLELGLELEKEQVYLAALLHDLGRLAEYENGIPHHMAGHGAAKEMLSAINYPKEKSNGILAAIAGHRKNGGRREEAETGTLKGVIKWADKKSRTCFWCKGKDACNWPVESRNLTIDI